MDRAVRFSEGSNRLSRQTKGFAWGLQARTKWSILAARSLTSRKLAGTDGLRGDEVDPDLDLMGQRLPPRGFPQPDNLEDLKQGVTARQAMARQRAVLNGGPGLAHPLCARPSGRFLACARPRVSPCAHRAPGIFRPSRLRVLRPAKKVARSIQFVLLCKKESSGPQPCRTSFVSASPWIGN